MTPQQTRMFRGRWYNSEKKGVGRPPENNGKQSRQNVGVNSTAEEIAEKSGVDARTVERDAQYATAVDSLAKPARDAIASGEVKATKAQNNAAEIKLLAERRAGDLLAGMEKQAGARDGKTGLHGATPLLEDIGIDKYESHRWQTEALVPEADFEAFVASLPGDVFEQHVAETKARDDGELTT